MSFLSLTRCIIVNSSDLKGLPTASRCWPIRSYFNVILTKTENYLSPHKCKDDEITYATVVDKTRYCDSRQSKFKQGPGVKTRQLYYSKARISKHNFDAIHNVAFLRLQIRHASSNSGIQSEGSENLIELNQLERLSSSEITDGCKYDKHLVKRYWNSSMNISNSNLESELVSYSKPSNMAPAAQLEQVLLERRLPPESIYGLYCRIPRPGVAYLSERVIRMLLHSLSVVEEETEFAMLRYLAVLDDMKTANKPLLCREWTSAMVLTGRCVRKTSAAEIESLLHLWRKMEQEANIEPSSVTFNVLFDVAVKAGKYALAEVLFKEMKNRNLRLNREFRTGYILYQGLRGNGEGVKMAYRELVSAGEIVDTTVLNCVITSLIAVGEISGAELVFQRMKALYFSKLDARLFPKDWRNVKDLSFLLNVAAEKYREDASTRQKVQDSVPIAPNSDTYRILARYHAYHSGNLDRITELVGEMLEFRLSIDRPMYFLLFKGFQIHGGLRYSAWTKARLEGLWASYKETLMLDPEKLSMQTYFAVAVLLAFQKSIGDYRAREVWEELTKLWKPVQNDVDIVMNKVTL